MNVKDFDALEKQCFDAGWKVRAATTSHLWMVVYQGSDRCEEYQEKAKIKMCEAMKSIEILRKELEAYK